MGKSTVRGSYETRRRQALTAPTLITVGAASQPSGALDPGDYYLVSTTDCYWRQGTGTPVAVNTDRVLPALFEIVVVVKETGVDDEIAALQVSAGGTLTIAPVEAVD